MNSLNFRKTISFRMIVPEMQNRKDISFLKCILTLYVSLFTGLVAMSQKPEMPKSAVSPNAAALGLFGEIPVSQYTGVPSINIPVDEINCGNVTMPISLDYHSAGVRPDQHPGWVGLGWSLNAGGMITRVVRGLPDDRLMSWAEHTTIQTSQGTIDWALDVSEHGYYYNCTSGIDYSSIQSLINLSQSGVIDTEPDEFSFNFMNISGKFFINNQGEWTVECDRPVKVEYTGSNTIDPYGNVIIRRDLKSRVPNFQAGVDNIRTNSSLHFTEFTITDEFGNKYIFGHKDTDFDSDKNLIEYSIDFFNQSHIDLKKDRCRGWHATSWMLQKIIATNGEEIEFYYQRGPFVNQLNASISQNSTYIYSNGISYFDGSGYQANYGGNLISPVYLGRINAPDGKQFVFEKSPTTELRYGTDKYRKFNGLQVDETKSLETMPFLEFKFPRSEYPVSFNNIPEEQLERLEWQQLDCIKIFYGLQDYMCKTININYSDNTQQRLTLNSIDIILGAATDKQTYKFDYYNMNLMPEYLSEKVDHWGYANDNNMHFIGQFASSVDPTTYFSSREPSQNLSTITAGLLKSITYPTGGMTELQYEPNDYRKSLGNIKWSGTEIVDLDINKNTGGVRVKKIINRPDPANEQTNIVKNYYYRRTYSGEESSGVLGGLPQYQHSVSYGANSNSNSYSANNFFSSQSVIPMSVNSAGSHIGYTTVFEETVGGGVTEYIFSNFDNGFMDKAPLETINAEEIIPAVSSSQNRGKLLRKIVYYSTNTSDIVSETVYGYDEFNSTDDVPGACLNIKKTIVPHETQNGEFVNLYYYAISGYTYLQNTHSFLKTSEREYVYGTSQNAKVAKISEYQYSNRLIKSVTLTDSINKIETRTNYNYPFELIPFNEPSGDQAKVWWKMSNRNFLNYPVEITKQINKISYITTPFKHKVIESTQVVESTYLNYLEKSNFEIPAPGNGFSEYARKLIKYDFVIDKVYDLKLSEPVAFINHISWNEPVLDERYDLVSELKYNNESKIVEFKDNAGITTFLWEPHYKYPSVVLKNIGYSELMATLENSAHNGFDRAELDNILAQQFPTRKILVNSFNFATWGTQLENIIDPRGIKSYFKYDSSNRLNQIEDTFLKPRQSFEYNYFKPSEE